jgi:hypothetical protein
MDKERDHIDKKVSSSFEGQSKKAPEGLWSGIESSIGLSPDEVAIRESFASSGQKTAPKSGWSGVKRQLIIDDVWANIAAFQDRRKRRAIIWWWSGSIATVMILSLLTWSWWANPTQRDWKVKFNPLVSIINEKQDQQLSTSASNDPSENNLRSQQAEAVLPLDVNSNSGLTENASNSSFDPFAIKGNASQVVGETTTTTFDKRSVIESASVSNSENQTDLAQKATDSLQLRSVQMPLHHSRSLESFDEFLDLSRFSRFEVGTHFAVGNTWIFNNDVRNGLRTNSLIKDKLSVGHSLGAELVFNVNNRQAFYASYDFISVVCQNYEFYQGGSLVSRRIKLNQQKALVGYKHKFTDRKLNKRNFVLRTGAFFAHSIDEEILTDGESKLTGFESIDFGATLAGGVEQPFERIVLEYGLRSDVGIYNIATGTQELPKKFNYTTSLSFEGYLSIRYKL